MSKKARRRPSWKKDNVYYPKGYKWVFQNGTLLVWHKSVENELAEVLRERNV